MMVNEGMCGEQAVVRLCFSLKRDANIPARHSLYFCFFSTHSFLYIEV